MINKGGQNILGMNPALPQGVPGHSLPQGMGIGGGGLGMGMPMGAQGDLGMGNPMGGQGAGFDLSEFPSLGGGPGGAGRSVMPGMGVGLQQFRSPQAFDLVQAANQGIAPQEPPKPAFAIESEDFPALPGALGAAPRRSGSFDGVPLSTEDLASQTPVDKADRFGLMGLLSVIRMTDQDLNTLALGAQPRPAAARRARPPTHPLHPTSTPTEPQSTLTFVSLPRCRDGPDDARPQPQLVRLLVRHLCLAVGRQPGAARPGVQLAAVLLHAAARAQDGSLLQVPARDALLHLL